MTITVRAWPPWQQANPASASIGQYVYVDNTSSSAITGTCGLLDSSGNLVSGYSGNAVTIPASVTNYPLAINGGPFVGGPVCPYFYDGASYYEASFNGTPSLNCPTIDRAFSFVGDIWVMSGQSNDAQFWSNWSGTQPTANSNVQMLVATIDATTGFPIPGTSYQTPTGASVYFLNLLSTNTGIPQLLVDGAIGGACITQAEAELLDYGSATMTTHLGGCYGSGTTCVIDYWLNTTGTPGTSSFIWPSLGTMVSMINNSFTGLIMGPGESEMLASPSDIATGLGQLYTNLCGLNTNGPNKITPAFVVEIGQTHIWDSYGGLWTNTQTGQKNFITANSNVYLGAETYDLPLDSGGVHFTTTGQTIKAFRLAKTILHKYYGK